MTQNTHPLSWYQMVKTFVTSHVTQDPSFKVHFCVVKRPFIDTINDRTCDWAPGHLRFGSPPTCSPALQSWL